MLSHLPERTLFKALSRAAAKMLDQMVLLCHAKLHIENTSWGYGGQLSLLQSQPADLNLYKANCHGKNKTIYMCF
jgi:hypothetical protein